MKPTEFRNRKRAYEANVEHLEGRRLSRVLYFESEIEDVGHFRSESVPGVGHQLFAGLDLEMSNGSVFHFTWGAQFFHHDVFMGIGSLNSDDDLVEVDASNEPEWRPHINRVVSRTQVFWSFVTHGEERIYYPQDVAIHFESNPPIYISASEYMPDDDKLFPIADETFVIFSDDAARKYRVGPYED